MLNKIIEAIESQRECLKNIRENFQEHELTYQDTANTIAYNFYLMKHAEAELTWPADNYCRLVIREFIAYFYEYFEDHGWIFLGAHVTSFDKDENHRRFSNLFADSSSKKHTPFTADLDATLEQFKKFCLAIYLEDEIAKANTVEVLLLAIKKNDLSTVQDIVYKEHDIISKVYPLNKSIDDLGFTPMMYAAKYSNDLVISEGMFIVLTGKRIKLNHVTNKIADKDSEFYGFSVLLIAARWGKPETFEYLISFLTKKAVSIQVSKIINAICHAYVKVDSLTTHLISLFNAENFSHFTFHISLAQSVFTNNCISKLKVLERKLYSPQLQIPKNDLRLVRSSSAEEVKGEEVKPNGRRTRETSASASPSPKRHIATRSGVRSLFSETNSSSPHPPATPSTPPENYTNHLSPCGRGRRAKRGG